MTEVHTTLKALQDLRISIEHFIDHETTSAFYHAPIIDHFHPSDYTQRGIQGLRKFLTHAKSEVDYVHSLASSPVEPKDFTTNAPHILALWHEFLRAPRPLGLISQVLECGNEGGVKVDVVGDGGNLWIKVNTCVDSYALADERMRISRLMAEFREQDSYLNSDYDSDSSSGSTNPRNQVSQKALSNSLILQAETLVRASKAFVRPKGQAAPRIKLILPRIEPPGDDLDDDRILQTFEAIRKMGVVVQFGPSLGMPLPPRETPDLHPTADIVLDLSVLVALCCDSTHQPLPTSDAELEGRFRPLQRSATGELELAEHSNVSSDLRDQLKWEMEHPLILEMQLRLAPLVTKGQKVRWWVTQEVKDRLPTLVEVIGGPAERRRGKALFGEGDFWESSRWCGDEGVLRDLRLEVLPSSEGDRRDLSDFDRGVIEACETFLNLGVSRTDLPTPPPTPSPDGVPGGNPSYPPQSKPNRTQKQKRGQRNNSFQISRLPTGHTLRTLLAGATRGWTVLTNNRGAVGKICREMGVHDGLSEGVFDGDSRSREWSQRAAVWVVNPCSLAEWRRLEVAAANKQLLASFTKEQLP